MEAKHTPGPWKLSQSTQFPFDLVVHASGEEILSMRLWAHASGQKTPADAMDGVGFKGDERNQVRAALARQVADLTLASAAPDLLEALKGAIGALEFSQDYHRDLGNEEQAFVADRLDAALAAIAKATSPSDTGRV